MVLTRGVDLNDEWVFNKWFRTWAQRTGINKDPDHRDAKYDFRAAWKKRADPVWNEELKNWEWQPQFSYAKKQMDEAMPPPKYELTLTINGAKLMPNEAMIAATEDAKEDKPDVV